MKKLSAVILAAVLAVSMTACGKNQNPQPEQSPLPSPPAQQQPQPSPEDKSDLDLFEIEATTLTECLVWSADDINTKTGKITFDYEDFFKKMAEVSEDDFTYYNFAPLNSSSKREYSPERCEVIAHQVFGKDITAKQIFDLEDYDKAKNLYIMSPETDFDSDYRCENLVYAADSSKTNATVTFDLLKEVEKNDVESFEKIGTAVFKFKMSSEKGGAYWTFDGFSMA